MRHLLVANKVIITILINLPLLAFADYSKNPFQYFDNNVTIGYEQTLIQDSASLTSAELNAVALFDNNLWLDVHADALVEYDFNNNNQGLSNLYQNKSGSSFGFAVGYAFNVNNFNIIPYWGFTYNNLLIAYNQNSMQQFIFENPSYNLKFGVNNEFILIDKILKFGLDMAVSYSVHKSVIPNTPDTLGHMDFTNYIFNISPSLQYNLASRLTLEGYYQFSSKFAGNANPPNVYYPLINVNSSNIINNDNIMNTVGIRFGILF